MIRNIIQAKRDVKPCLRVHLRSPRTGKPIAMSIVYARPRCHLLLARAMFGGEAYGRQMEP